MTRPNPYGGMSPNPEGKVGNQKPKGRVNGRRPLDFAPANLVHRTRGVGSFTFTGQPSDGDTVTVTSTVNGGSKTFEFESGGGVAAGNIAVTIGASTSDTADNLWSTMLANGVGIDLGLQPTRHSAGGGDELVGIVAVGPPGIDATLAESATNVTAEPMSAGKDHGSPKIMALSRVPTAAEVTSGVMLFATDMLIRGHLLSIRDSSNALKAFDGSSKSDNFFGIVEVDNDGASTPFTDTDTVSVLVWAENVAYEDTVVFD